MFKKSLPKKPKKKKKSTPQHAEANFSANLTFKKTFEDFTSPLQLLNTRLSPNQPDFFFLKPGILYDASHRIQGPANPPTPKNRIQQAVLQLLKRHNPAAPPCLASPYCLQCDRRAQLLCPSGCRGAALFISLGQQQTLAAIGSPFFHSVHLKKKNLHGGKKKRQQDSDVNKTPPINASEAQKASSAPPPSPKDPAAGRGKATAKGAPPGWKPLPQRLAEASRPTGGAGIPGPRFLTNKPP